MHGYRRFCFLLFQRFDIAFQLVKAAVRIGFNSLARAVDQAVGQKERLHPQLAGDHVLAHVVAHHGTFLGSATDLLQNIFVIARIGLAIAGIFIGGEMLEIIGGKSCPRHALFGGDRGEEGIGGKHATDALLLEKFDDLLCFGRIFFN